MTTQTHAPALVTRPSDREIRTERVFEAPRDLVWKAFTDPKLLAKWWGRGNKLDIERLEVKPGGRWRFVEHALLEVKPGGRWRFVEHAPDGTTGFEGRYREVSPPNRIVQTFEWDGMPGYVIVTTADLVELGADRTKVVTTSLFHTSGERDGMLRSGMEQGMNQSYEALDRLLEEQR